ncbi:hypothetical protein BDZ91DRAFT_133936 [Kalaharituber pfeilii]|nr:hypothetical protein BDZ91DRAFT_133936 [Kalaharituber pfeilii]
MSRCPENLWKPYNNPARPTCKLPAVRNPHAAARRPHTAARRPHIAARSPAAARNPVAARSPAAARKSRRCSESRRRSEVPSLLRVRPPSPSPAPLKIPRWSSRKKLYPSPATPPSPLQISANING